MITIVLVCFGYAHLSQPCANQEHQNGSKYQNNIGYGIMCSLWLGMEQTCRLRRHSNCRREITMQYTGLGYRAHPRSKHNIKIYNSLMYKNSTTRTGRTLNTCNQYWLLHDNNHYHSINNIKAFLAVDYFCPHCLQGFTNKKSSWQPQTRNNAKTVYVTQIIRSK